MTRRLLWTVNVRRSDGDDEALNVEIAASSAVGALISAVAELVDARPDLVSRLVPDEVDGLDEWPDYVTVSRMSGGGFVVECRCGAVWDNARPGLVAETVATYHGPSRCEPRWPENRLAVEPPPDNADGKQIRQRRVAAGMTQAQLAEAAGVSAPTISTAERIPGGVSGEMLARIFNTLDGLAHTTENQAAVGRGRTCPQDDRRVGLPDFDASMAAIRGLGSEQ